MSSTDVTATSLGAKFKCCDWRPQLSKHITDIFVNCKILLNEQPSPFMFNNCQKNVNKKCESSFYFYEHIR